MCHLSKIRGGAPAAIAWRSHAQVTAIWNKIPIISAIDRIHTNTFEPDCIVISLGGRAKTIAILLGSSFVGDANSPCKIRTWKWGNGVALSLSGVINQEYSGLQRGARLRSAGKLRMVRRILQAGRQRCAAGKFHSRDGLGAGLSGSRVCREFEPERQGRDRQRQNLRASDLGGMGPDPRPGDKPSARAGRFTADFKGSATDVMQSSIQANGSLGD